MGMRLIEVMQVLVDQVHKYGYQLRALEDDIYAESQKRIAAEKDRDHWKQARQEAIEAGELMRAEIETLRTQLDVAQAALTRERLDAEERDREIERLQAFVNLSRRLLGANIAYADVGRLRAGLAELDAGTEPTPVAEPLDAEGGA